MRVTGVGYTQFYFPQLQVRPAAATGAPAQVMSKEDMLKLLSLMAYNQSGMAFKLARVAAQMYAGLNLDYTA